MRRHPWGVRLDPSPSYLAGGMTFYPDPTVDSSMRWKYGQNARQANLHIWPIKHGSPHMWGLGFEYFWPGFAYFKPTVHSGEGLSTHFGVLSTTHG